MPCESCAVQFSVFRRKRMCGECERFYCAACLRRGGGVMCAPCRVLSTRPLLRPTLLNLKVKDMQCFLHRQNVSTRGCVEKEELVSLVVSHVNSPAYRRRGGRASSAFGSLKGFTSNINDLLNSAFSAPPAAPTAPPHNNANGQKPHSQASASTSASVHVSRQDNEAPHSPDEWCGDGGEEREGGGRRRVDTADCFEIEDLDEGWELVRRPADPLPDDSVELLAPPRAASSEPELSGAAEEEEEEEAPRGGGERRVSLSALRQAADVEALSVRQLKQLLASNRVEFRGCVERAELLRLALRLLGDARRYSGEPPAADCCRICMAAPLECVLLECGHIAACTACAKQLAECPFCRQYVVRAVRFFRC